MLRFLAGDYPKKYHVRKPEDIDRMYVHAGKWTRISRYLNLSNAVQNRVMSHGMNVMFVREPYSRLWSAYLDKFYLPDFWSKLGPLFRQEQRSHCINNISFNEFLIYIVKHSKHLDLHWAPISQICDICQVKYDVIGKMETFIEDSRYILKHIGSEKSIDVRQIDTTTREMEEIQLLTKYNFKFTRNKRKCFERTIIAKRLWRTFQMNGYIHDSMVFPLEMINNQSFYSKALSEFTKYAFEALEKQNQLFLDPKPQRREYMMNAYKSIPMQLLIKVKALYRYDFEMFGYNADEIFDNEINL